MHIFRGVSEEDKGFTLLEVLIALVIFCVAAFSSIMIFKNSLLRFDKQIGEKKVYSEAIKVFDYTERYLSSAMCNDMDGKFRINFEGRDSYVRFISPFSEGQESDLAKFGIYFDSECNKVKVSIIRIDRKCPDFVFPVGFPGAQVLGEDIGMFKISYYDGRNWKDCWDTSSMSEPVLPRLVRIEIAPFSQKIEGKRYEETFEKVIKIVSD